MMDALTLSFPSFSIVIPTWVFVILPMLAGVLAMWRSGVNEAVGIAKVSSGDFNTQDHPNINFCRMGLWRVMAYAAALLFLLLAIQMTVSKPAAVSQGEPLSLRQETDKVLFPTLFDSDEDHSGEFNMEYFVDPLNRQVEQGALQALLAAGQRCRDANLTSRREFLNTFWDEIRSGGHLPAGIRILNTNWYFNDPTSDDYSDYSLSTEPVTDAELSAYLRMTTIHDPVPKRPFFEMKREFTTEYDLPGGKVEFTYWAHERCDEELAASVAPESKYHTIFDNSEGRRMALSRKLWNRLRDGGLPAEVSLRRMHFYPDDTATKITIDMSTTTSTVIREILGPSDMFGELDPISSSFPTAIFFPTASIAGTFVWSHRYWG